MGALHPPADVKPDPHCLTIFQQPLLSHQPLDKQNGKAASLETRKLLTHHAVRLHVGVRLCDLVFAN